MRVKISYAVEIDEVVEEVTELFGYVADKIVKIESQSETIRDLLYEEDAQSARQVMQKLRGSLAAADARLADLCLILEGYDQYMKQQEVNDETSSGRPAVDTAGDNAIQGAEQPNGGEV